MKVNLIQKTLFVLLALSAPAQALTVKHTFAVTVGAFEASQVIFEYTLDRSKYAVNSQVATQGVFDILYPFQAEYSTSGKITGDNLQTANYSYRSQSRFSSRTKKVVYNREGIPIRIITGKNGREKVKTVKVGEDIKHTTDLQTVVAAMVAQYNQSGHCSATMRVFDGKRRFNVVFEDVGSEFLSDTAFKGEAVKCSMYIDRLKEDGDDMLWKMTSQSPVYFWILTEPETHAPFVAKINVEHTPLGEMNVYTSAIEVKK